MSDDRTGFTLQRVPDWLKVVLAALFTSGILIGYGRVTGASDSEARRLDHLETDYSSKQHEAEAANIRQGEQIAALSRRVDELERGRETNRENIATLVARMAVVDNQQISIARTLSDIAAGLKEHILHTEATSSRNANGSHN